MSLIYIARSANLCKWGADVGLGKHICRIGVAPDKSVMKTVIDAGWAGENDWRLIGADDAAAELDEETAWTNAARKEKPVDPNYYPRLKGAAGVFRVNIAHVQNAMLVSQAMASADQPLTAPQPKAKDIAAYLIRAAKG